MELSIKDRLVLPLLLPMKGTYAEYQMKKNILDKINLTAADAELVELREDKTNGHWVWDKQKEKPLAVSLTEDEKAYLLRCMESKSGDELSDDLWNTVEKLYEQLT